MVNNNTGIMFRRNCSYFINRFWNIYKNLMTLFLKYLHDGIHPCLFLRNVK